MSLLDFFTQEAGQRRRAAIDDLGRALGTYVPPELRGLLGLIAESTPTASIDRASQSAVRMVEPGRTMGQRFGDLGGLLSEIAGVVAPAMVAPRAGMTATQALEEMFMMPAAGVDDAARQFMVDDSGALNFRGQSKLPTEAVFSSAPSQPDRAIRSRADALIDSGEFDSLPSQRVSVAQITPTQRFLGRENMERVAGAGDDTGAYLLKQGDQYFVLDGHHRIAENISEGRGFVNARVFDAGPPLPAPRNEAEAAAREILEMRASGRAGDVTDELMAQADPQYMFANTPLPMDYESRMRRAITQGFDVNDEMYRGDAPRQSFETGRGQRDQIGVTMSTRPDVAASYIPPRGEGGVYPLVTRGLNDASIEAGGQNWNVITPDTPVFFQGEQSRLSDYIPVGDYFEPYDIKAGTAFFDTNDLSRLYQGYGADRVRFNDLVDRGASAKYYGPESSMPSDVQMVADPANIRSRFARFDPEFRHLRNLSAGVGGLGLLATQSPEQQREEELRQYLGGLL